MACTHNHSHPDYQPEMHRAFLIGAVLNTGFVAVEAFYGWRGHSLSLVADALHNLGDVLGLLISWLGYYFAFRPPTPRFTFGFGRVSVYATVFNGLLLCASTFWIIYEAWERLHHPQGMDSLVVGIVAAIGIAINSATALFLMRGRHDMNVRGTMLHMLADAGVSAGVVTSAFVIAATGFLWIDPALSAAIAALIFLSGWPLLFEGIRLALDGVPKHVDDRTIRQFLESHPDLEGVFDLRIWALGTTKNALSAHVTIKPGRDADAAVRQLHDVLRKDFGMTHVTLQVEKDHLHCE